MGIHRVFAVLGTVTGFSTDGIEVCEHFRLNPYQLTSIGSMLMVTDKGEELADALMKEGIKASVIGRLAEGNDKIICNGEEIRYVDRPAPDEIKKIFQ